MVRLAQRPGKFEVAESDDFQFRLNYTSSPQNDTARGPAHPLGALKCPSKLSHYLQRKRDKGIGKRNKVGFHVTGEIYAPVGVTP